MSFTLLPPVVSGLNLGTFPWTPLNDQAVDRGDGVFLDGFTNTGDGDDLIRGDVLDGSRGDLGSGGSSPGENGGGGVIGFTTVVGIDISNNSTLNMARGNNYIRAVVGSAGAGGDGGNGANGLVSIFGAGQSIASTNAGNGGGLELRAVLEHQA